jgi:hypothetical protein
VCTPGQRVGCDLNGDLSPQLNELGVSTGFAFGTNNRYADGLQWPVSNEYNIELQRQLPGNIVLSAGYTRRETRRNIGTRNVAVPSDTYIRLQVTEAQSGTPVTVYNQAPALRGKTDYLWDNAPEFDTNFNGGDFTATRRLNNHWSMAGGASFGKTVGDIYAASAVAQVDLNNPNNTFRGGVVGNDVPWSYRMSGVYDLPRHIWLSGTWQFYQGFPETTTVSVGNNTVALTQGTQVLTVEPRGTTRLPSVSSLDVSVRKTWKALNKSFEPRIDLYNLTNNATILGRIPQLGPTYQRVSNIQRGRLIKVGMSVEF